MTSQGLTIPAGKTRGLMLVTAHQDAPRSLASVTFTGRAQIGEATVVRPCRLASVAWPIPDSWSEIPRPRLLADVAVSVSGVDFAPISIAPAGTDVREVVSGEKLAIPLVKTLRSEFSGADDAAQDDGSGL